MRETRLTEPRHFSNIERGTFRSKIYLPVITPWQRRFPGYVTPGNVRVRARVSLSSAFFLCTLRASLRERGRVRIIMALRVLTLHLLSRMVIHVSPHVPSRVGSLIFFPPRTRPAPPDILLRDSKLRAVFAGTWAQGYRKDAVELKATAQSNKMSVMTTPSRDSIMIP